MAESRASISFSELEYVVGIMHRAGRNVVAEVTPQVAESLVAEVQEVFETEGYGSWPGFWWQREGLPKPSTKGKRGRRWRGNPKLLRDTGNLAGSITPDAYDDVAEAFTNVPYAKFHVSRRPRSKIPLRDFFAIDEERFASDVADMLLRYLDHRIAAE